MASNSPLLQFRPEWRNLRTRLAPTPSGYLHLGNIYSILLTWLLARIHSGTVHLRIDDLDIDRCEDKFTDAIFVQLSSVGIDWDTGPGNLADHKATFTQPKRFAEYQRALLENSLIKEKLYACDCSRKTLQDLNGSSVYPGFCRDKQIPLEATDVAWRVAVPSELDRTEFVDENYHSFQCKLSEISGDFVVRRRDKIPAYHLVSVLEDANHSIDFLVRGKDLLESTATQICLAKLMGINTFANARFLHHPLVLDEKKQKLSKSRAAPNASLLMFDNAGAKEDLFAQFSVWAGAPLKQKISSLNDLKNLVLDHTT